ASGSNSSAKAATAKKSASPSARESRSMADTDEKAPKADKPKAAKGEKPEKGDKAKQAQQAPKGGKAAKGEAADKGQKAEGGDHQGAQVDRHLQGARRPGDRLQGDAAQDPHVRVRRPAGEHRAAARARLPRAVAQKFRRARQLYHRHQGAPDFPGDRLRQGH